MLVDDSNSDQSPAVSRQESGRSYAEAYRELMNRFTTRVRLGGAEGSGSNQDWQ